MIGFNAYKFFEDQPDELSQEGDRFSVAMGNDSPMGAWFIGLPEFGCFVRVRQYQRDSDTPLWSRELEQCPMQADGLPDIKTGWAQVTDPEQEFLDLVNQLWQYTGIMKFVPAHFRPRCSRCGVYPAEYPDDLCWSCCPSSQFRFGPEAAFGKLNNERNGQ